MDVFVAGDPALDFLNTAGGRGKERDVDRLPSFAAAIDWAVAAGVVDDGEGEELAARAGRSPRAADRALTELRVQREAPHAFLRALVAGERVPADAQRQVEEDLREAYGAARLGTRLDGDAWTIGITSAGLGLIGRRLALATGRLLASEDRQYISSCGRCSWLFLDRSPSRRRRWCSMAACGNRAKAERHYHRT